MKLVIAFISLFFITRQASAQITPDSTIIKKMMEEETLAFANADLPTWSGYFVHEPYLRWAVSAPKDPTRILFFDGWDALYKGAKSFLDSKSGRKDANALHQITRKDWNIHIIGDMAWVKYVQITEGDPIAAHEFRVLERKDGVWKIAMLNSLH